MSESQYVPMRLRNFEGNETAKPTPTHIYMMPHRCNHTFTICPDCAWSWEVDYEVLYDATAAGRKLRDRKREAPAPRVPAVDLSDLLPRPVV